MEFVNNSLTHYAMCYGSKYKFHEFGHFAQQATKIICTVCCVSENLNVFGRLVKDISQQENVAEETSAVKIKPVYSAETVKLICKGPYRKVYEDREKERESE